MHIVLVEPEIPGNTGNISRLCAAEHLTLHLVEPLGFSIDDKHLKRAGLDYWDLLEVHVHPDFSSVERMLKGHHFYYNTTKAVKAYTEVSFREDDVAGIRQGNQRASGGYAPGPPGGLYPDPHDRRSPFSQFIQRGSHCGTGSTEADRFPPSFAGKRPVV